MDEHDGEFPENGLLEEDHYAPVASSPSPESLPYDERLAYASYSSKPVKPSLINRPRRRSTRPPLPSPTTKRRATPRVSMNSPPPSPSASFPINEMPPPSLGGILSAMTSILSLYWNHHSQSLQNSYRKARKCVFGTFGAIFLVFLMWLSILFRGLYVDAVRMCTPPPNYIPFERPLVEYYVHGRGNGHYARSMVIIESLNDAGVDVRMFIGRSTMWNSFNQATPPPDGNQKRGITTAIAVTSILPELDFFSTLSHTLERILGDCEVALQTKRYPVLVVTDGDMPGMLRAKLGSIPSVGISHGQIFSIGQKPDWISEDTRLDSAWDKEGRTNRVAAWFCSWQIGIYFGHLEPQVPSAVIARPPLRPELAQTKRSRMHTTVNPLVAADAATAKRMKALLLYGSEAPSISEKSMTIPDSKTRKIILCYFRDQNGQTVADTLLQAGFDVLIFQTGHSKDSGKTGNHYGRKWIVKREDRLKMRKAAQLESTDVSTALPKKRGGKKKPHHRRLEEKHDPATEVAEMVHRQVLGGSDGPRLIRVTDRTLFLPFMSIADGIAASAGSQLISECIYANIPLLALYRKDDAEQNLNVEMSRQERAVRKTMPIFGTSLESFASLASAPYSNLLRGNGTSSVNVKSAETKFAYSEFQAFSDKVRESTVSEAYYTQLQSSENETGTFPPDDPLDDPFHGMPDAAAVLLEIIKQLQKDERR